MDALFAFVSDFQDSSDAPDISKKIRELADVLSTRSFKNFYEKHEASLTWILHTLICVAQSIFSSFAKIASDHSFQRKLANGDAIPVSTFDHCWEIFHDSVRNIKLSLNSSNPRAFAVPPASYTSRKRKALILDADPGPPLNLPDKYRNRNGNPDAATRGRLKGSGRFAFPKDLSDVPCRDFALVGSSCTFGRRYQFSHKVFPGNWKFGDREAIISWVESFENVQFADLGNVKEVKSSIKK